MEGKELKKLDMAIFWDDIRLEGFKKFLDLRNISPSTRHNGLKYISVLLSELLITSTLKNQEGDIFRCWKKLRNWANIAKKVYINNR